MKESASSKEPRRRARRRALQALYQWQVNPVAVPELLAQFRQTQDFGNVDDAWFEALVRGVSETSDQLATDLAPFMGRDFASLDLIEQIILKMSAWELRYAPDLPVPVILNEAVDLARRFGAEQGHSFVNAVLDRAARQWRPGEGRDRVTTAVEDDG